MANRLVAFSRRGSYKRYACVHRVDCTKDPRARRCSFHMFHFLVPGGIHSLHSVDAVEKAPVLSCLCSAHPTTLQRCSCTVAVRACYCTPSKGSSSAPAPRIFVPEGMRRCNKSHQGLHGDLHSGPRRLFLILRML